MIDSGIVNLLPAYCLTHDHGLDQPAARTIWNLCTGPSIADLPSNWPQPLFSLMAEGLAHSERVYRYIRDATASLLTFTAQKCDLGPDDETLSWFLASIDPTPVSKEVIFLVYGLSFSPAHHGALLRSVGIISQLIQLLENDGASCEMRFMLQKIFANLKRMPLGLQMLSQIPSPPAHAILPFRATSDDVSETALQILAAASLKPNVTAKREASDSPLSPPSPRSVLLALLAPLDIAGLV
jgi:hypothetical protein